MSTDKDLSDEEPLVPCTESLLKTHIPLSHTGIRLSRFCFTGIPKYSSIGQLLENSKQQSYYFSTFAEKQPSEEFPPTFQCLKMFRDMDLTTCHLCLSRQLQFPFILLKFVSLLINVLPSLVAKENLSLSNHCNNHDTNPGPGSSRHEEVRDG